MPMEHLARALVNQLPLFFGLSPKQMKAFLDICKLNRHHLGEVICEYGTSSNALFILVEGHLDIIGADGTVVATTAPMTTVGEMGFIGRKPRLATVKVRDDCRILTVKYHDFENLMQSDFQLSTRVYRNMIHILSDKLSDANDMTVRYKKLYESGKSPAPEEAETPGEEIAATAGEEEQEQEQEACEVASEDSDREDIIRQFYSRAKVEFNPEQLKRDAQTFTELLKDGYTDADIEYAAKWTVRNIPGVKRFGMVKLGIAEAFEDKRHM